MKLTIIGAGNMGSAIARGLVSGSLIKPFDITCADRSKAALDGVSRIHAAIRTATDNRAAVRDAEIVLLAVKPWLLEEVIYEIKGELDCARQILVSIAGGVTFAQIDSYLDRPPGAVPALFRLIPNTAVEVQQSMTFIASQNASESQVDTVVRIFDELGATMIVDERLMAAGTALASCGIAYAFRYIRAAMEGGVELGFYPAQARDIVAQTLKGAVALMQAGGRHPEEEIDRVTTPGGITVRGLNEMEHAGFTSAVIRGLKASK
ncbi:MAG: pyrroline-5-carboxylate reductase [Tannerella sp.]|jgi:pyrroline-5-carboxylate reductase|nr:pyrroline-5-carboxylate reductase [Tannerella sp.]